MVDAVTPLEWIAEHAIVMQSARHPLFPSLVEFIAGEPIKGSWWGHEKGREIFRALVKVYESPDVVSTKLVEGKQTLLHKAVWAPLATLAFEERIAAARLAKITQEHTESGRHEKREEPFPDWLPRGMRFPSVQEAIRAIGAKKVASLLEPGGATPPSPASAGRAARARRR